MGERESIMCCIDSMLHFVCYGLLEVTECSPLRVTVHKGVHFFILN